MRLPLAGGGRASTLEYTTSVLQTCIEFTPWRQPRHAKFIASFKPPSFFATEPTSRPKVAALMQRTWADRSCGRQDTTWVQVSAHEEPHSDWQHTGWLGFGRHMLGCFCPFADMPVT